jgi:hypothetical protein
VTHFFLLFILTMMYNNDHVKKKITLQFFKNLFPIYLTSTLTINSTFNILVPWYCTCRGKLFAHVSDSLLVSFLFVLIQKVSYLIQGLIVVSYFFYTFRKKRKKTRRNSMWVKFIIKKKKIYKNSWDLKYV